MLQLIVVTTPDWDAVEGNLYRFERSTTLSPWKEVGSPIPVTVGKKGMAWGIEISDVPCKREGDLKSPAGIYSLGTAFGDLAHKKYAVKLSYLVIEQDTECVDDPSSGFYNQFVDAKTEPRDWTSSEKMLEVGHYYAIGIEVKYNSDPIMPGFGSCIFIHVWKDRNSGTAGCTAMQEDNLNEIVSWLNVDKQPAIVQLPLQEYPKKQKMWNLPNLEGELVSDDFQRNP